MRNGSRKIVLLDTTLRDGDQSPGFAFSRSEKIRIACLLEKTGVDIVEVGFPSSSRAQAEDIKIISGQLEKATVSVLSRAIIPEITKAGESVSCARKKMLHLTIATSPLHREYKLKKSCNEILKMAEEAVLWAKQFADYVEIGAEDATRTELPFLNDFCRCVIEAGADVVNVADTVGYSNPAEYSAIIRYLYQKNAEFRDGNCRLSVHCHNDLGMAIANTMAGLEAGAEQAEVTVLGFGERGGNAPLEELAALLKVRKDYYNFMFNSINTFYIGECTREVARISGVVIQPNKAVAGRNAFSHGSGIHQNGFNACESTYSILNPQDYGYGKYSIVLSRHSGTSGLRTRIKELCGLDLMGSGLDLFCSQFKALADRKKLVSNTDMIELISRAGLVKTTIWYLRQLSVTSLMNNNEAEFLISLELMNNDGDLLQLKGSGSGSPVNPLLKIFNDEFHFCIILNELQFSLNENLIERQGRLYMKAEAHGRNFCEERMGSNQIKLFAECLLDVVNQLLLMDVSFRESSELEEVKELFI